MPNHYSALKFERKNSAYIDDKKKAKNGWGSDKGKKNDSEGSN